jgi:hypothetical protein
MSLRGHPGIGRPAGHGHAYASPGRPGAYRAWVVAAFLPGTIARGALGDPDTAGRALQSALDLTEPDQVLFPFLIDPPPGVFDCHTRHHILGIGQHHADHARGHL